jgi:hypothetical protein
MYYQLKEVMDNLCENMTVFNEHTNNLTISLTKSLKSLHLHLSYMNHIILLIVFIFVFFNLTFQSLTHINYKFHLKILFH